MHKHLGHALAQSSLAAVLRALKTSAQVPGTQHLLRSCAMVLRLYVHIDETQSLFLAFDLYIISRIRNILLKMKKQTCLSDIIDKCKSLKHILI